MNTSGARAGRWISTVRSQGQKLTTRSKQLLARTQRDSHRRPERPSATQASLDRTVSRTRLKASSRSMPHRFVDPGRRNGSDDVPAWLKKGGTAAWMTIGILLVTSFVFWAVSQVSAVFVAIFLAFVITSVLNPVVNFLSKFLPRSLGVLIALLGAIAIFGGLITYVIASVTSQWSTLSDQFGNGIDKIIDFLRTGPFRVELSSDEVYQWINQTVDQARQYIESNAGALIQEALNNISSVAIGMTIFALAIFTTIFLLYSGEKMWRWTLNRFPDRHREPLHRAAAAGWFTFAGYARGIMLVASTDGLFAFIYLSILSVPLAAPLGVLVFIGAFIPLIGAPTAMIFAMIVALAADGVWTMLLVGIGIALIGQFEGHVLQPLIMGSQVSLHPVVVGVGVAAGTLVAGLLGAVISIPLIASAWAIYQQLHEDDPPFEGPLPSAREVVKGTE
ncbi:MAG: AI-2E family transporter [Actinomycetaceae bacterium]|nr:AI-2E family transporter [Actinomycetaceae bacterium]